MTNNISCDFHLSPDFGDLRLSRRLENIVEHLAAHPASSVPEASETWANTKGAYRFWDNPAVTPKAIIQSQIDPTLKRIAECTEILAVQDTTTLGYSNHPATKGLGYNNNKEGHGYHVHTTMAVNSFGTPIGILDLQTWIRETHKKENKTAIARKPIEEKESYRWLTAEKATLSSVPPTIHVITVADREADILEFLGRARPSNADFIIRKDHDRLIDSNTEKTIEDAVKTFPAAGSLEISVGRSSSQEKRIATVEVNFGNVQILAPSSRPGWQRLAPVSVFVIQAKEVGCKLGEKPIHWILITSIKLKTLAEASKCVRFYSYRWLIERYHYVLKSGCRVEDLQLETRDRLERALATYTIVAWRLLYLRYLERSLPPETQADVALSATEWKALCCFHNKTKFPPPTPPLLSMAMIWLAQLGGFLARKHDGHPGVKVLWRGLRRLDDIAAAYELFVGDMGNA